jgi:hypothetical protein
MHEHLDSAKGIVYLDTIGLSGMNGTVTQEWSHTGES